ncbi:MAG: Gfo/Idh/MocA family protein [Anaerolineae bacterium]
MDNSTNGIRIGVIGLGAITTYMHIPSLQADPRAKVVAGCDINEYQANRVQEQFGLEQIFTDWGAMLEQASLDAVVIGLPSTLHQTAAEESLAAGCHVLCEKPLGLDPEKAEALAAQADKLERVLMVGYHNRFLPSFQKARRIVREGEIGSPLQVRGTFVMGGPFISWEPKSAWYQSKEARGVLYDGGSHIFDLIHFVTGINVGEIKALAGKYNPDNEVPDQIAITWQSEGGCLGTAQLSWGGKTARQEIFIYGEKGHLIATPQECEVRTAQHNRFTDLFSHLDGALGIVTFLVSKKLKGGPPQHYRAQASAFLDAIQGQSSEYVSLKDSLTTLRELASVEESLREQYEGEL